MFDQRPLHSVGNTEGPKDRLPRFLQRVRLLLCDLIILVPDDRQRQLEHEGTDEEDDHHEEDDRHEAEPPRVLDTTGTFSMWIMGTSSGAYE